MKYFISTLNLPKISIFLVMPPLPSELWTQVPFTCYLWSQAQLVNIIMEFKKKMVRYQK